MPKVAVVEEVVEAVVGVVVVVVTEGVVATVLAAEAPIVGQRTGEVVAPAMAVEAPAMPMEVFDHTLEGDQATLIGLSGQVRLPVLVHQAIEVVAPPKDFRKPM